MQVFCPGILYLLPSLLLQRRVEAAPCPSAHFLHGRRWPTVSSLCLGLTTTPALPAKQIAGETLTRMAQRWVGYGALIHPLHPPQLSLFPSLFNTGGDGDGPKAVAVPSCSLRNAPLLTSLGLHSRPGIDPLAPKACPCKPGWGHLLLDPSWVTQAGTQAVAVGGYLHSGKAPNHALSLLTAVLQCLLSLSHECPDVS